MAVIRKRWSTKARLRIFLAHDGRCHCCQGKIDVGQLWHLDHVIPLALGGDDAESNLAPAHAKTCHGAKTAETDVPAIAKAKRREAAHRGAVAPKRPIRSPASRRPLRSTRPALRTSPACRPCPAFPSTSRPDGATAVIHDTIVIIPAPTEPVAVDLTALTLKVGFPLALIWSAVTLTYCLFANGVL